LSDSCCALSLRNGFREQIALTRAGQGPGERHQPDASIFAANPRLTTGSIVFVDIDTRSLDSVGV
jgi:hypothetical protein